MIPAWSCSASNRGPTFQAQAADLASIISGEVSGPANIVALATQARSVAVWGSRSADDLPRFFAEFVPCVSMPFAFLQLLKALACNSGIVARVGKHTYGTGHDEADLDSLHSALSGNSLRIALGSGFRLRRLSPWCFLANLAAPILLLLLLWAWLPTSSRHRRSRMPSLHVALNPWWRCQASPFAGGAV